MEKGRRVYIRHRKGPQGATPCQISLESALHEERAELNKLVGKYDDTIRPG